MQIIARMVLIVLNKTRINNMEAVAIMDEIALMRGCITNGRQIDYNRVSKLILDEFAKA